MILRFNNWEEGESIKKLKSGRSSALSKFVTSGEVKRCQNPGALPSWGECEPSMPESRLA